MRLRPAWATGLVVLLLASPAIAPAQDAPYPRTVRDSFGTETIVPSAERVFVVHQITSSIVSALGAYDRVVGRTEFVTEPSEYMDDVPAIGSYSALDAEGILSVSPDLLLITDRHVGLAAGNLSTIEQLRETGVAVLVLPHDALVEERGGVYDLAVMEELVSLVAEAIDDEEAGAAIVAEMEAQAEEAARIVADVETPPRVLALGAFSQDGSMYAQGPASPYDLVIRMAGAENVAAEMGPGSFHDLTPEGLVALAPDTIVIGRPFFDALSETDPMAAFLALPGIADTPAGRDRAFHFVSRTVAYGSTPHLAAAALDLAATLYPD